MVGWQGRRAGEGGILRGEMTWRGGEVCLYWDWLRVSLLV